MCKSTSNASTGPILLFLYAGNVSIYTVNPIAVRKNFGSLLNFFLNTERIDERFRPPHPTADSSLLRMHGSFLGHKADMPLAYRVIVHKCAI